MKTYAFRLQPDQDLKISIKNYVRENKIKAGVILSCVGSLSGAALRMADKNVTKVFDGKFEIVSLAGTLSPDGCHLHISLSDKDGNVIGGHLNEGCIINTTAEIVIGEIENLSFSRVVDESTGFKELVVQGGSTIASVS
ncbi:MAG: DNA-binding protein [Leadbetterella sp.]|nr:DNA-binding protein [Leadbetterella sp.]